MVKISKIAGISNNRRNFTQCPKFEKKGRNFQRNKC